LIKIDNPLARAGPPSGFNGGLQTVDAVESGTNQFTKEEEPTRDQSCRQIGHVTAAPRVPHYIDHQTVSVLLKVVDFGIDLRNHRNGIGAKFWNTKKADLVPFRFVTAEKVELSGPLAQSQHEI